jgi:hypothetical protein
MPVPAVLPPPADTPPSGGGSVVVVAAGGCVVVGASVVVVVSGAVVVVDSGGVVVVVVVLVVVVVSGGVVVVVVVLVVVVVSGGGGGPHVKTIPTLPLDTRSGPIRRSTVIDSPRTRVPDMETMAPATASQFRISALEVPLVRMKSLSSCSEALFPVCAVPVQSQPTIPGSTSTDATRIIFPSAE